MATNEQNPGVWDDDERTVLSLPPSRLAGKGVAETADAPVDPAETEDSEPEAGPDSNSTFQEEDSEEEPSSWGSRAAAEPVAPIPSTQVTSEEEPFDRLGTTRVGLLGGKGVGKSYLFQALVYRTLDGRRSGALSYYTDHDSVRVYQTLDRNITPRSVIPNRFVEDYSSWMRLPFTSFTNQQWYRLRLQFRTGLLGSRRSFLDVDFLDGSGEALEMGISAETEEIWKNAFLDAQVMVFCLPLWAAFPASGGVLSEADWAHRKDVIDGFDAVVRHFKDLREKYGATHKVRSILALTMADDRRSALVTLRDRWIHPFMEDPRGHLNALRTGSGIARYLANARKISDALWREFDNSPYPVISSIPVSLDFGAGRPWFIPVSAIDGAVLDAQPESGAQRSPGQQAPPVPVHVELPLLVALCESHNALM